MSTEQNTTYSRLTPLFFPLLQLLLVLLLLRNFLWQSEWILSTREGGDIFVQFYAWRQFAINHLLAGEFPFWNPHLFGGIPFFGGVQSALLYPLNILFLFLPTAVAINWSIALHLWLMGLFTTLWLRQGLRVSHLAAGTGGVMMMLSAPFFLHIYAGHLTNLSVMIWVPLVLLAIDRWFAGDDERWLALGAVAVAMQIFAGHPQYLYYTGLAVLLYGTWHLLRHSRNRPRDITGLIILYLTGTLLGAVQLLPGFEAASASVRAHGLSADFAGVGSLPPAHLVTLLAPHLLDLATDKPWLWETTLYFGVIALALAVIGGADRRHPRARGLVLLIAMVMILAMGRHTPLFPLLLKLIPGFDLFRGTSKFAFFATLFAVALAAIGMDRLQLLHRDEASRLVKPLLAISAALAIALLVLGLLMGDPGNSNALFARHEGVTTLTADLGLAIAMLVLLALLLWRQSCGSRHALPLIAVLSTLELFFNSTTHLPGFRESEIQHHPIVESLRTHSGDGRVLNLGYYNAGMVASRHELWGHDPGIGRRWAEFIAATQHIAVPEHQYFEIATLAPPLAIARLEWQLRTTPSGVTIHVPATTPFPHVQLFHTIEVAAPNTLLQRLMEPAFDFRQTLLVEEPLPGFTDRKGSGSAALLKSTLNTLEIRVKTDIPAVLLVTDAYDEGWQVEDLSGKYSRDYRVIPADHAFIGVPLEAGDHHIRLEYRPRSFTSGLLLSVLGILLLAALLWRRSPTRAKMATL